MRRIFDVVQSIAKYHLLIWDWVLYISIMFYHHNLQDGSKSLKMSTGAYRFFNGNNGRLSA